MRWLTGRDERAGWVKAPPAVEVEIRTVWQEDELPEEMTSSPGHIVFTLGQEAQEWVDSMAEVVDGGKAVYGRPKSVAPTARRQLATPPPPDPAPRPVIPPSSVPHDTARHPAPMPDIAAPRQPPEIADAPRRTNTFRFTPPVQHHTPMPEIGGPEASPPRPAQRRPRTLPRRVLMPEIGEESHAQPPLMPEIGE